MAEQIFVNDTFSIVKILGSITIETEFEVCVPTSAASNQTALLNAIQARASSKTLEQARIILATQDLSSEVIITIAPAVPAAPSDVNPTVTSS